MLRMLLSWRQAEMEGMFIIWVTSQNHFPRSAPLGFITEFLKSLQSTGLCLFLIRPSKKGRFKARRVVHMLHLFDWLLNLTWKHPETSPGCFRERGSPSLWTTNSLGVRSGLLPKSLLGGIIFLFYGRLSTAVFLWLTTLVFDQVCCSPLPCFSSSFLVSKHFNATFF